jgi:hypothetical protein
VGRSGEGMQVGKRNEVVWSENRKGRNKVGLRISAKFISHGGRDVGR